MPNNLTQKVKKQINNLLIYSSINEQDNNGWNTSGILGKMCLNPQSNEGVLRKMDGKKDK